MKSSKFLEKLFLGIIIIFLIFFIFYFDVLSNFSIEYFKFLIKDLGVFGPIVFIFLMILSIVISPIPALPLAAFAGMVFGPLLGTIFTLIGAIVGATISFLIGRCFGEDLCKLILKKEVKIFQNTTENKLMFFIFVMRLFPFFQFDVVSYGAGLTKIKLWKFVIATFFGMIPMTFIFVYYGVMLTINLWLGLIITLVFILMFYLMNKYLI